MTKKVLFIIIITLLISIDVFAQLDIGSDANIDKNYRFYKTIVGFKTDHSEYTEIAIEYLEKLLIKKGWTIYNGTQPEYDLVTAPMFKKHKNFSNTGYSYLTMNLYFFKNPKTGNKDSVIDAFVAKRISSNNLREEIKIMCYEIIKKIPSASNNNQDVGFVPAQDDFTPIKN
jgi:hypothetical protein